MENKLKKRSTIYEIPEASVIELQVEISILSDPRSDSLERITGEREGNDNNW